MTPASEVGISILLGYLVGSVNPSYIIAKFKGFDIRKAGSGNAGGSNALITMGKTVGVICCLFDIFKAYFIVRILTGLFGGTKAIFAVTSTACIIGHMFPFYMHFKGGKGLACLGGSILAYSPVVFLIFLGVELVVALLLDYICVVPITASVAFPITYACLEGFTLGGIFFLPVTVAMLYKHTENLKRISQGTELHLSYLWHKDEEKDRINENIKKIDESKIDSVWNEHK